MQDLAHLVLAAGLQDREHLVAGGEHRRADGDLGRAAAHHRDQARARRQAEAVDLLADARALGADLDLDDLEVLLAQLQQVHQVVLGHLVLDQGHDPQGGADRRRHAQQVEVDLVARVVDPGDHLLHAVALARELGDDEVVLVVAGHGHDDVGGPCHARQLQHVELGAVAVDDPVAELPLQHVRASGVLLHDHHLAIALHQGARHVGADLPASHDDGEHQTTSRAFVAHLASFSMAICTGEMISKPRSAYASARAGSWIRAATWGTE